MLLKNKLVNKEFKGERKKHLGRNENGSTTYQNLCDTAKAVLRGKFTVIQAYLKKQQKNLK